MPPVLFCFVFVTLELLEVDPELRRRHINIPPVLLHGLDPLRAEPHADSALEGGRDVLLGLEVNVLDLLDALVGESHDTGLAVGALAKEIADTASREGSLEDGE